MKYEKQLKKLQINIRPIMKNKWQEYKIPNIFTHNIRAPLASH